MARRPIRNGATSRTNAGTPSTSRRKSGTFGFPPCGRQDQDEWNRGTAEGRLRGDGPVADRVALRGRHLPIIGHESPGLPGQSREAKGSQGLRKNQRMAVASASVTPSQTVSSPEAVEYPMELTPLR